MAGNRIKGITVEIGGDTQGLDKALKGVNDTSKDLQKELRDVSKLLKFDPKNAELLAQKQKLLNDQIENASEKLKTLKDAEQDVQKQFERGDIGADQYRAFQRELQDTQSYLRNTQNALQDLQDEQRDSAKRTQELKNLFAVTGTELEDFADVIGSKMVRSIQQGTASSKDLERAFEKIAKESIGASTDVGKIRTALGQLESGESSIKGVRKQLQKLGEDANESEGQVKELGSELGNLIAGAGAGMGLGAIFEKSMDMSELDTQIELTMDIPEESNQSIKDAVKTVGGYIEDNESALEGVRRQFQLNAGLTDEENTRILKGAGLISKAYKDIDFKELISETHELANGMGLTHDDALAMTKALLDAGFPPDQLDIITEYGQQLNRAGYDAKEIQGIMIAGVETGTWNIDNLLDGLKEGRIIMSEFATEIPDSLATALKGTDISAKQVQEWGKAIASGGNEGKQAFEDVALALSKVEDDTKRNALGVQFYGTLWEEQGDMITETVLNASSKTGDLAENQRKLNEDIAKLDASPQQRLNQALQELWTTLQPLLAQVTEFVVKVADWIAKNPELSATIIAIVSAIGILIGIFLVLSPIITALIGLSTTLGITIGAIASPILIIIGVIGLLIAIGVLLYKNWDEIVAWSKKTWKSVSESFTKMKESVSQKMSETWNSIKEIWGKVQAFFEGIDLKQIGKNIIQGLINGIREMAGKVVESAKQIANGIGDKISSILKLGSPSKLLEEMGINTGEGMVNGLKKSIGMVKDMAGKLGKSAVPDMDFDMKGAKASAGSGKQMTVNIHSPKALDVRSANREFQRTLNKMSLMW